MRIFNHCIVLSGYFGGNVVTHLIRSLSSSSAVAKACQYET